MATFLVFICSVVMAILFTGIAVDIDAKYSTNPLEGEWIIVLMVIFWLVLFYAGMLLFNPASFLP